MLRCSPDPSSPSVFASANVNPHSQTACQPCGELSRSFGQRLPSTLVLSLLSGVLLWAAFPPLGWWPLAWIAPVGWLLLVRCERLPGRRPYRVLAAASLIHWLAVLQGIRLAHPALYLGWFALSAYLAVYPVLFVLLTRIAVHRWRISIVGAAPVVWTGLELVRGHAITGFSMALLGHTQISWIALLQMADVCGAYGVSFVVMLVAAALARMGPVAGRSTASAPKWTAWPAVVAGMVLVAVLAYGRYRQAESERRTTALPGLRVALLQGSFDTVFEFDPERDRRVFQRYRELGEQAVRKRPDVQLVVWPESMFSGDLGEILVEGAIEPPPDVPLDPEEYRFRIRSRAEAFRYKLQDTAQRLNAASGSQGPVADGTGIHLIVGTDTLQVTADRMRRYNAALSVNPAGQVTGRYYKMHRVMFGEYIPWGEVFPWLYRLTPMTQGIDTGPNPACFQVADWRISPSICFESTVPHLIRRQVQALRRSGDPPDVLVNVTNDGWFWGTSILDLQLACAVYRAAENRLPVLVAANTGLSAVIDGQGQILNRGHPREEAIVYGEIQTDGRLSWYQRIGDIPAGLCALFCLAAAVNGLWGFRRNKMGEPGRY